MDARTIRLEEHRVLYPKALEILLAAYYVGGGWRKRQSQIVQCERSALARLRFLGLVELHYVNSYHESVNRCVESLQVTCTKKGDFYVDALCRIPAPVESQEFKFPCS